MLNSNLRLRLLIVGLLLLLLSIVVVASSVATTAIPAPITNIYSSSCYSYINDRITQVEKSVNSQGDLVYQIQRSLSDIQQDIDSLRGQIQINQHKLCKLIDNQRDIYSRIKSLALANNISNNNRDGDAAINIKKLPTSTAKCNNEKNKYEAALNLAINSTTKEQIAKAISSFQYFIKTYPKSNYQASAHYWLGQLNYNRGYKDDAIFYFATVVKNYPNSPKIAESLYKVGLLMQIQGENAKAKIIYQQVINNYPNSLIAKLAEKKLASLSFLSTNTRSKSSNTNNNNNNT